MKKLLVIFLAVLLALIPVASMAEETVDTEAFRFQLVSDLEQFAVLQTMALTALNQDADGIQSWNFVAESGDMELGNICFAYRESDNTFFLKSDILNEKAIAFQGEDMLPFAERLINLCIEDEVQKAAALEGLKVASSFLTSSAPVEDYVSPISEMLAGIMANFDLEAFMAPINEVMASIETSEMELEPGAYQMFAKITKQNLIDLMTALWNSFGSLLPYGMGETEMDWNSVFDFMAGDVQITLSTDAEGAFANETVTLPVQMYDQAANVIFILVNQSDETGIYYNYECYIAMNDEVVYLLSGNYLMDDAGNKSMDITGYLGESYYTLGYVNSKNEENGLFNGVTLYLITGTGDEVENTFALSATANEYEDGTGEAVLALTMNDLLLGGLQITTGVVEAPVLDFSDPIYPVNMTDEELNDLYIDLLGNVFAFALSFYDMGE